LSEKHILERKLTDMRMVSMDGTYYFLCPQFVQCINLQHTFPGRRREAGRGYIWFYEATEPEEKPS
jgi:hypothetical protein